MKDRLSPKKAPPTTAAATKGRVIEVLSAKPAAIGISATIVPTLVPIQREVRQAARKRPAKANLAGKNRRVTLAELTLDGEQVGETEVLAGDCLYNSAATKVDERFDLLFPTYYNTHGGTTDTCSFRCYLADGPFMHELPCELNRWVEEDEAWALASPGFIFINGERYLAFCTRTASHENSHTGMISKYKLIKVVLEYE